MLRPVNVSERALMALDFPRVLAELSRRCATAAGQELARVLTPVSDPQVTQRELDEVEDALFGVSLSLAGVRDVQDEVARAQEGRVLLGTELLQVAYSLDALMTVRAATLGQSRGPLREIAADIGEHSELVADILRSLDRDGEVRDSASPLLRDLRRRSGPLQARIRERMGAVLEQWSEHLQENIVTLRRDRYVVPVRAGALGNVSGIVVDASGSGQSFFVEPASVTPLNNELARIRLEEEAEVRRILHALSGQIATDRDIDTSLRIAALLDLIAAKAALARDWRLTRAEPAPEGEYRLEAARHPLIEHPVPNDLRLDAERRLLLITGPNMGGKTVTLKTLGLCALMNACGMYVPAHRAALPPLDAVLVDIGDEQSIEASLSTFAAHLLHLREVLAGAGPRALVLVDELGSGTDPGEGAGLAQAILEELLERGARGIVTSHLGPLKSFAQHTEGLQNASMGFDVETLSPTHRLLVGQPGRSYALHIAARMGLDEDLLARARELVGPEAERLEDLLAAMEREREAAAAELREAERTRMRAQREAVELAEERAAFAAERDDLLRAAAERMDEAYAGAIEQIRQRRVRAREDDGARPRIVQELGQLRRQAQALRPAPPPEPKGDPLKPGSVVDVPAYGASGQVLEVRGDQLVVQLGLLKVSVRRRDVRLQREKETTPQRRRAFSDFQGTAPSGFAGELQLRGRHAEDAVEEVRQAIAEAQSLGEKRLRLVHGKGQGVLRRLLRDYLKNDRRVSEYTDAPPGEGGHGVTLVTLK